MRKRLGHLRPGLLASALALVVAALLGVATGGATNALGAAAGVALAAFSFTVSSLVLAWTDLVDRRLILTVGLLTYVVKFSAFGVLLYVVTRSGWAGRNAVAWGLIAGTLAWATTQAVWVYRSRIPYVDLTEAKGRADS